MQVPASSDQLFLLASLMLAMTIARSLPFFNPQAPATCVLLALQHPAFDCITGAHCQACDAVCLPGRSHGKLFALFCAHRLATDNQVRCLALTRPAISTAAPTTERICSSTLRQSFQAGLAMYSCKNLGAYVRLVCSAASGVFGPNSPPCQMIDLSLRADDRLMVTMHDPVAIVLPGCSTWQDNSLVSGAASSGRVTFVPIRSSLPDDCSPVSCTDTQRTCVTRAAHFFCIFCDEIGRLDSCTLTTYQCTGTGEAADEQEPADVAGRPSQRRAWSAGLWNDCRAPFVIDLSVVETTTCACSTGAGDLLLPITDNGSAAVHSPFFSIPFATVHADWKRGSHLPHCFDSGRNVQDGPLLPMLCIGVASIARINGFKDRLSFTTQVLSVCLAERIWNQRAARAVAI